jgi:hypothetical protein
MFVSVHLFYWDSVSPLQLILQLQARINRRVILAIKSVCYLNLQMTVMTIFVCTPYSILHVIALRGRS